MLGAGGSSCDKKSDDNISLIGTGHKQVNVDVRELMAKFVEDGNGQAGQPKTFTLVKSGAWQDGKSFALTTSKAHVQQDLHAHHPRTFGADFGTSKSGLA